MSRITESRVMERAEIYLAVLRWQGVDVEGLRIYRPGTEYAWRLVKISDDNGETVLCFIGDSNREALDWLNGGISTCYMVRNRGN